MSSNQKPSVNHDVPVKLAELEKWFQPEEWKLYKLEHLNYMAKRDTFFHDDDVIVATFPRSGTHIGWYIVQLLVHGADFESNVYSFDDLHIIDRFADHSLQPGPVRVLHSHFKPCDISHQALQTGNRRVIHFIRNPKDACLSFYKLYLDVPNFFTRLTSFHDWATTFCSDKTMSHGHNWVDHTRAWEEFSHTPGTQILTVVFEDFIKDKRGLIERISQFLKLDRSPEEIDTVAKKLAFDNMKTFMSADSKATIFAASPNEDASYFKKGKVGSWKEEFTVALSEKFDADIKERMTGSKFYSLYY